MPFVDGFDITCNFQPMYSCGQDIWTTTTLFVMGGTFVLIVISPLAPNVMFVPVVGVVLIPMTPPWMSWLKSQASPTPGVDGMILDSELVVFKPECNGGPPKLFPTNLNDWLGAKDGTPTFVISRKPPF